MKALFFSPFANIWEHSFPESLVADGLQKQGVEVITVRCDRLFQDFCIAMSASGLNATDKLSKRKQVCAACIKRRNFIDQSFNFDSLILEGYLSEEDYEAVSELVENTTLNNWTTQLLHGIPIGKYAAYEFLLNYKVLGTDIPSELFPVYLIQLKNSSLSLLAAEKIIEETKPDRVITYNRLYGINHGFLAVAERQGIPTYSLQGGGHVIHRGETITMFRDSQTQFQVLSSPNWENYKKIPLGESDINIVSTHLAGLREASSAFAYSSEYEARNPDELRIRLGIPDTAQVLLIPMSSEDELNAAELSDLLPDRSLRPNVFGDQFEWLRFIFTFARSQPDLKFILRLHPRMYPNKRENVTAPVLKKVLALIQDAPSNIIINYPTDDISLYDLMQIVDVTLGYRSTVGVELAAYGIPVVAPANRDFYSYPDDIQRVGFTQEEYVSQIHIALSEGWSLENIRSAYRWLSFLFTRMSVDFSDSVNAKPSTIRPKKPGLKLWLWRKMVFMIIQFGPLVRERISMRNRATSQLSKDVIFDVLSNKLPNLSDSKVWPKKVGHLKVENKELLSELNSMSTGIWADIKSDNSLTSKVRNYLNTR
jgi:hypothetical protein